MNIITATKDTFTGEWQVRSPFAAKDIIKMAVPTYQRRWSKPERCWYVDAAAWPGLKRTLQSVGYTVVDVSQKPPPRTSPKAATSWVRQAFEACSPELRPKLRAGLLRVFHPDVGGPPDLAKEINTTADELAPAGGS